MSTTTSSRASEFRKQLSQRVIVADGAMGTMLYSRGVFINRCFDELNLSSPDMVRQIHQEYVKAGAEVLETNTFGATRQRLAAFGVAEKLKAINHAGVRIAREAAQDGAFVAGGAGPPGGGGGAPGAASVVRGGGGFPGTKESLICAGAGPSSFTKIRNL